VSAGQGFHAASTSDILSYGIGPRDCGLEQLLCYNYETPCIRTGAHQEKPR